MYCDDADDNGDKLLIDMRTNDNLDTGYCLGFMKWSTHHLVLKNPRSIHWIGSNGPLIRICTRCTIKYMMVCQKHV